MFYKRDSNKSKNVIAISFIEVVDFMTQNKNCFYFLSCRHDWYQNETHVIITILAKNIKNECVTIEFQETSVSSQQN